MAKVRNREITPTPFSIARQFTGPPFSVSLESAELRSRLMLELARQGDAGPAVPGETNAKPAKPRAPHRSPSKSKRKKRAVRPRSR
jgi:hypothetical protein